jgi:hypothetical protein
MNCLFLGYHRGVPVSVNVQTVHCRKLAAVRREVVPGTVGSAWGPALGKVWEFISSEPGLRTDGHNIFLYHHPQQPGAPMNEAHNAIGKWMAANRRESAGHSWEIYGDPTPDPADTQTTVVYLLN